MKERDLIHNRLGQRCKDYGIDRWSIASQDGEYKIMYIVMQVNNLNKFMRKNKYINQYEDWRFTTKYEGLEVTKGEVVFLFHDQCKE